MTDTNDVVTVFHKETESKIAQETVEFFSNTKGFYTHHLSPKPNRYWIKQKNGLWHSIPRDVAEFRGLC